MVGMDMCKIISKIKQTFLSICWNDSRFKQFQKIDDIIWIRHFNSQDGDKNNWTTISVILEGFLI